MEWSTVLLVALVMAVLVGLAFLRGAKIVGDALFKGWGERPRPVQKSQ